MVRTSSSTRWYRSADVLETTLIPSTLDNALISSSAIPAQKYPWSPSGLRSSKGSTATDRPACDLSPGETGSSRRTGATSR